MKRRSAKFEARWNEWFKTYHRAIHGYLYSLTQSVHLADDLTQETFLRVWERYDSYEERGSAKAFLFRVATHCLKDWFRRHSETLCDEETWNIMLEQESDELPDQMAEKSEEAKILHEIMKFLTPAQRQVLTMHFFGQLKFQEIAESLEMPLNTVLSHARRGMIVLKEKFGANP
ncbi:MAG: RNA polymerase sigma factor [Thermoguttaceae bacterium]|nr:RNA polymerase sigma factor [Thermoguttaceae bacterium]